MTLISLFKISKPTYWHLIQRCPGTQASPMGHKQLSHLHLRKQKENPVGRGILGNRFPPQTEKLEDDKKQ